VRNLTLLLFFAIASAVGQTPLPSVPPSIVYFAHNSDAIQDYETNPRIARGMVDRLVLAVTGQPDLIKAWGSLVGPNDKVGIKISAEGGELFTSHRDVVKAIIDGLVAAGHSRQNIIVWDRSIAGALEAGYKTDAPDYQLKGITPRDGYDPQAIFSAPLIGKLIWGDLEYKAEKGKMRPLSDNENTSSNSHFSRIISTEVTKIINVPIMSNSGTNGLAGCLYNVTLPNLDNWRRFAQGSGFGAESIAEIYNNPVIGKKVVLNLMDGLLAVYAGGPQSQPNYSVHHGTLYASKDPVALDSVALKRLDQWRKEANFLPTGRLASYLEYAGQIGLGNSESSRIEVRNVSH
jgi:Domain of unknown function (DUF362)